MNQRSAFEEVDELGLEGLRQLARAVGLCSWTEPPEVGFWESVFNGLPDRTYIGCVPIAYRRMAGATDSVIVEWELIGPRAHANVLAAVADQMLTSLRINRVLKQERVDRSNRVIQILTNDRIVHHPPEIVVDPEIPTRSIELRSHRTARPAQLFRTEPGAWHVGLNRKESARG